MPKITELPETTSLGSSDVIPVVFDSAGSPVTKKITKANLAASVVSDHAEIATGIHGVGASTIESISGSQAKVDVHENLATAVHGISGAVVGTTDTQTLTNKTLNSPVIDAPTLTGIIDIGNTDARIYRSGANLTLQLGTGDLDIYSPATGFTTAKIANDGKITMFSASGIGAILNASSIATSSKTFTFPNTTGTIALTANKLSDFAATTSAQLAGVISDETGSGALVFATTPTLVTPEIGVATGTSLDLGTTTLYASRAITVDTGGVLNIDIGSAAGDDFTVDTSKLVVEGDTGNVGIGTAGPLTKLHISAAADPALRLSEANSTTFYSQITDVSADRMELIKVTGTGAAVIDIDPRPADGTSTATFRFFRQTNTSGRTSFDVYTGNNTATINSSFAGNGNSYLNVLTGNVGIGTAGPTAVLHLKAGTATASTAPLKLTSGTLNTTAEVGAVEFLTDKFYGTITTGAARKTFAFLESPSFTTPTLGVASATSLTLTTKLAIAEGGTGASTAATALANLGGVALTGNQTIAGIKTFSDNLVLATGKGVTLSAYDLEDTGYLALWPGLTMRDHFKAAAIDAYWTAWSTTPAIVTYNWRNHILYANPSGAQQNVTCFLHKTQAPPTGASIMAWVGADSNSCEVGLRMDNGSDDSFIEFYIKGGVGTYSMYDAALFYRYQLAGGGITAVQISSPFLGGQAFNLRLARSSTTLFYLYSGKDVPSGYTAGYNFASAWTPTRHGLFVRNLTASGARPGYFHWYSTNF